MSETIRAVCEQVARWAWTDQHGVAQCINCGTPYQLLHYEGEGDSRKRVDKPHTCLFTDAELPMWRRIFHETGAAEPSLANFAHLCEALRLDPGVLLGNRRILVDPAEGLEDDEDRHLVRTLVARLSRHERERRGSK